MVKTIVARMKELGAQWNTKNSDSVNDALHQKAVQLAKQLDQYGVHAEFRSGDGTWWITQDKLNPKNVGKLLHSCYHTGGFIGSEPLKPNEQYIKAENGELMLTANQQDSFAAQVEQIKTMTDTFSDAIVSMPQLSVAGGMSSAERDTINNITNNSRPIEVNIGDTIIHGNASKETVQQHIKVTKEMADQIWNMVRRLR